MSFIAAHPTQKASSYRAGVLCAGVGLIGALCVALPLATWAVAIAFFGLPHVLMEMRYVAHRFGVRLRSLALLIGAPLALALAARAASSAQLIGPQTGGVVELACGALLAACAVRGMRRRRIAGMIVAAVIVAGAYVSAPTTLLLLALLHNFTPVAFLADAAPDGGKSREAMRAGALFLLPPLIILTGAPFALLDSSGWTAPAWSPLHAGRLDVAILAYVPAALAQTDWALHAFSAAVMAQCLHYYATIRILPSLMPPRQSDGAVTAIAALVSMALTGFFLTDYAAAKSLYGLAALAHSWIEIPVLLLALDSYADNKSPAANEAPLADSDRASARAADSGMANA